MKKDLESAGFVTYDEKSVQESIQVLNCSGIAWNLVLGTLKGVNWRINKILYSVEQIIDSSFVASVRKLPSLIGQITSTGPVVRNIARIIDTLCRVYTVYWSLGLLISPWQLLSGRFFFWKNNIVNIIDRRDCFVSNCPSYFMYSYASTNGCGLVVGFNNDCMP